MLDRMDPLTMAQLNAAEWCLEVKHQADYVAKRRRDLADALVSLESVAKRAERALSDVAAIKTIQGLMPA